MADTTIFRNFLLSNGYKIVEDNERLRFSTYEYDGVYIRLSREVDGKFFIELSRANNSNWEGWYSMDVVRFLILKMPYEKGGPIDFEYLSQFFIEHYEVISEAFHPNNFSNTETAFAVLKKQRAKALFGYEE